MGLKHLFASPAAASSNPALVDGPNWNDDHYFLDAAHAPIGAVGDLPYRGTDGLLTLLAGAQGLLQSAGSGQVPAYTMHPTVTTLTATGAVSAGAFVLAGGGVSIDATELAVLDGVVPGTVTASKAVVVDANKDIASFRNLTASGVITTPVINGGGNILQQRNGANAQTFQIFSTYTDAGNYEGLSFRFSGAGGEARIQTIFIGSGQARSLALGAGGAEHWRINTSGHFVAGLDNTYDIGASGATRPRTLYVGSHLIAGGALQIGAANAMTWSGLTRMVSGTDGVLVLSNNAQTNFTRLILGTNDGAGIGLRKSGTQLDFVTGDGASWIGVAAEGFHAQSTVLVGTNPSNAGAIRLPNSGHIGWRNAANTGDVGVRLDGSNYLTAGGGTIYPSGIKWETASNGGLHVLGSQVRAVGGYVFGSDAVTGTLVTNDTQVVANDAVISLGPGATIGLLLVTETAGLTCGVFLIGNAAPTMAASMGGTFSVAAGTAGKINVYWSATNSRYELENKAGASRTIRLVRLGS